MDNERENHNVYIIPPNFIETGTFFGGAFKVRNAIEAGALVIATGAPAFKLPVSLTARIIIVCVTSLPLGLFALIGVSGDSLSEFILAFIRFLSRRRIIGASTDGVMKRPGVNAKKNTIRGEMCQE